jgi:hypothetical protein
MPFGQEPQYGLIGGDCKPKPPLVGVECGLKTPLVCEPIAYCLQAATANRQFTYRYAWAPILERWSPMGLTFGGRPSSS